MAYNKDYGDHKEPAWMLDSGATNYYTLNRYILRNFKHYIDPEGITTGGGRIMADVTASSRRYFLPT